MVVNGSHRVQTMMFEHCKHTRKLLRLPADVCKPATTKNIVRIIYTRSRRSSEYKWLMSLVVVILMMIHLDSKDGDNSQLTGRLYKYHKYQESKSEIGKRSYRPSRCLDILQDWRSYPTTKSRKNLEKNDSFFVAMMFLPNCVNVIFTV